MKDEKTPEEIEEILAPADLSDIKLDTLSGDVRDVLLQNVQQMKRPWSMLTEQEQYDVANSLELASKDLVRNAVRMLTEFRYPRAVVTLSKINIIGGDNSRIDGTNTAANIQQNRDVLGEHVGQHVALLAIDSTQFMEERAPVKIDKDQSELPMDGEEGDDEANGDPGEPEDWEALISKAETYIRAEEKASTSYIQRKLAIGYNRAAKIIEELEARGVLSPADHVGKRSILPPKGKGETPEGDAA